MFGIAARFLRGGFGLGPHRPVRPWIGRSGVRLDGSARLARLAAGLLLAGALAGAGAPGASAAPPAVEDLELIDPYFSPDGDGVLDATAIAFLPVADSASVDVEVRALTEPGGVLVATLLPTGTRPAGVAMEVPWAPAPLAVADGAYRLEVRVTAGPDVAVASAVVVVDTVDPTVELGYDANPVGPSPFDPTAPPPFDRLLVPVRVGGDSTSAADVTIADETGAPLLGLGAVDGPGEATLAWDGAGSDSTLLPSARYQVRATARDLAGNAAEASVFVRLDRTFPVFSVTGDDTVRTSSFPVAVRGIASDEHRVTMVEASLDSGATWTAPDSVGAAAAAVPWVVLVDDPAPVPGLRRVLVRAADVFGHVTEATRLVGYDTIVPQAGDITFPDGEPAVSDGDTLRMLSTWNAPGLRVTADLATLDSGWQAGRETVTDLGDGTYEIVYRVSPTNTRAPGPKTVTLRAVANVLSGRTTTSVTLRDAHGGRLVSVDRNRFDPQAGDRVTIAAAGAAAAVEVQIFDLAGHLVRTLSSSGYVEWDGRDDDGSAVASGVYFLRAKVDDREEIRKVAVLRGGGGS